MRNVEPIVAGIASCRQVRAYMFWGLVHGSSVSCSSVAIMNPCFSFGGERLGHALAQSGSWNPGLVLGPGKV